MALYNAPLFVPGGPELLILVFVLVLLFWGPKKIPEVARSMGQATQEIRKGHEQSREELEQELKQVEDSTDASENEDREMENASEN